MTELKQKLDKKIEVMKASSIADRHIARRLLLYDFAEVFNNAPERGFNILNSVTKRFGLAFSEVRIVGSAQTGYSYYSGRDFVPGKSDLDLAIISPALFEHYSREV